MFTQFGLAAVVLLLIVFLASSLRILREYERGVVFQLGRFWSVKGPGLVLLIPGIQQMVKVDLRVKVLDIPSQDVISRDNVSVKVNAVLYFRVVDAEKAVIEVENYLAATSQLSQTTLRAVLGKHDLDEMLSEREKMNLDIQKILEAQTQDWGIKVTNVEIKHVDLAENMVRAIARQAEAERERRAKVIHAEGELQASYKLAEAAAILAKEPQAIQLRYLETLHAIGADKNSTIVFPMPLDIVGPLLEAIKGKIIMKTVLQILKAKANQQVLSVPPDATVFDAISLMSEKNVGALLVMQGAGQKVLGIVTERDYARKVILAGRSSKEAKVREIMSSPVRCVPPDTKNEECMALMTEHRLRHLPVQDGDELLGVVSIGDLVADIISEQQFLIEQLEHYIAGSSQMGQL